MTVINRNSGSPIFNTLAEAQASNMDVGQLPIVLGTSGAFDGGGIIYSVQPNGSGGLSMSNGNELVKYTGTAAVLDVMTDLSDPASGSLMPPGAFGVGDKLSKNLNDSSQLAVNSFNAFTTPIFGSGASQGWPFTSNWWGGIKLPTTFSTYAPYLLNNLTELYYGTANVADGTEGGVPWRKIYDQRNILGTVSQSGGVPTGAVIERGSNANGEYVKFADGTMICTIIGIGSGSIDINVGAGSIFSSNSVAFSSPAPFVGDAFGIASDADSSAIWGNVRQFNATAFQLELSFGISVTGRSADVLLVGRWF